VRGTDTVAGVVLGMKGRILDLVVVGVVARAYMHNALWKGSVRHDVVNRKHIAIATAGKNKLDYTWCSAVSLISKQFNV